VLQQKHLIVPLTPSGRGQVVTHALYQAQELEHLREKYKGYVAGDDAHEGDEEPVARATSHRPPTAAATLSTSHSGDEIVHLRREVAELRDDVARLKKEIEDLWSNLRST
jgi:hypothetical protein